MIHPFFEFVFKPKNFFWIDSHSWWSWFPLPLFHFPKSTGKGPTKGKESESFPLFSLKISNSDSPFHFLSPFNLLSPFPPPIRHHQHSSYSLFLNFIPSLPLSHSAPCFFLPQKQNFLLKSTALFINFTFRSFNLLLYPLFPSFSILKILSTFPFLFLPM